MKYLVMETHPSYAVLLDEEGRFLKAANMRYQVGETVEKIVAIREPCAQNRSFIKPLAGFVALAACFCVMFFGYYQPNYMAYGTLRIRINPDVEMTLSRTDRVIGLAGLNEDGKNLVEGYDHQGKTRDLVTDELMNRAIEMGYLSDGDVISISVNSRDTDWRQTEEEQIRRHLEDRYGESIVITVGVSSQENADTQGGDGQETVEVIIPSTPSSPATTGSPPPTASTVRPIDDVPDSGDDPDDDDDVPNDDDDDPDNGDDVPDDDDDVPNGGDDVPDDDDDVPNGGDDDSDDDGDDSDDDDDDPDDDGDDPDNDDDDPDDDDDDPDDDDDDSDDDGDDSDDDDDDSDDDDDDSDGRRISKNP